MPITASYLTSRAPKKKSFETVINQFRFKNTHVNVDSFRLVGTYIRKQFVMTTIDASKSLKVSIQKKARDIERYECIPNSIYMFRTYNYSASILHFDDVHNNAYT